MSAARRKAAAAPVGAMLEDLEAQLAAAEQAEDPAAADRALRRAAALNRIDNVRHGLRALTGLLAAGDPDEVSYYGIAALLDALADQLDPVTAELIITG